MNSLISYVFLFPLFTRYAISICFLRHYLYACIPNAGPVLETIQSTRVSNTRTNPPRGKRNRISAYETKNKQGISAKLQNF